MKNTFSKLVLSTGAILGLSLAASNVDAQHYYPGNSNYNSSGYHNNTYRNSGYSNNRYPSQSYNHSGNYNRGNDTYATLGLHVSSLNSYGSQMTQAYRDEVRNYGGCRDSGAFFNEMRRYNGYTGDLAKAYRGSCPKSFRKSSANVRNSMARLQTLRRKARVSNRVCGYMTQSQPLISYVNTNCSSFRPYGTPAPQYRSRPAYGYSVQASSRDSGGFDWGSAFIGAIAGRIIHGAASH